MSAANEQQFMLQWKGRQSGPLSLLHIREQLGLGEISRMHQVSFNGRWITLGEFLDKHAGPSPEEKLRAEAAKREQQMRHKFETELADERARKNAVEQQLAEAERRPHHFQPLHPPHERANSEPENTADTPQVSESRNDPRLMLGLFGSALLILGAFCPIVSVPILGSLNYFMNGKGDGTIICVLAGGSALFSLARLFPWLWLTGGGSLGMLIYTFTRFQSGMKDAQRKLSSDLQDNPFREAAQGMMDSVQIQWGFAVLVIGALLVIAAAAIPNSNASKEP